MIKLEIKGLPELTTAFQNLAEKGQRKILRQGLKAAGDITLSAAKEIVPVDTGELKNALNVKVTVGKTKARAKLNTGSAKHGHLVELGVPSRGIPAQPFLRSALYDNRDSTRAEFIKSLDGAIKDAGFKNAKIQQMSAAKRARKIQRIKKKFAKTKKNTIKTVKGWFKNGR